MERKIPLRLKKEPLLEAIWEIRFSGNKSSVADLLPGMLFKALPGRYRSITRQNNVFQPHEAGNGG